jgi:carboxylesterase
MASPVTSGCEPFAASGGDLGVLVLHGFTGCPYSMRGIADALANRGYSVELPLLPGHGTSVDDLVPMRWADWSAAAAAAYDELAGRSRRVAAVGLSMGGGLAAWLAEERPELAALVLVNPLVKPIATELRDGVTDLLAAGVVTIDGVANDIAKPGADEFGYAAVPIEAAASLMDGLEGVAVALGAITCPTLVLTSRQDHVVSTDNSELVVASASGPVEQVWLERSFHVATLDFDAELIESETCRFLDRAFESV